MIIFEYKDRKRGKLSSEITRVNWKIKKSYLIETDNLLQDTDDDPIIDYMELRPTF